MTDRMDRTLSARAIVIEVSAPHGKLCRLIDHTGTIPESGMKSLLDDLIRLRRFGWAGHSLAGSHTIRLGEPEFTHIQLGESLSLDPIAL